MTVECLEAPAKINLTLEILGDLPGGYHEVDSVYATLELADRLFWKSASQTRLTLSGDAGGLPVELGENNLVIRALRVLEAASGRSIPLEIRLEKQIPAGGGLGGGSGDAAALLYGVNRSHQLGFSEEQLQQMAAPLGADVAFGVLGGVARARGRGEVLESLGTLPDSPEIVLVFPPFGCPTGAVYQAWDVGRPRPARGSTAAFVEKLSRGEWGGLANDLEPAAEEVQPPLAEIRKAIEDFGRVLLCGSGSTLSCWDCQAEDVARAVAPWNCKVLTTRVLGQRR